MKIGFIEMPDKIGVDKVLHEFFSFVICVGVAFICTYYIKTEIGTGMAIGFFVTIAVDVFKEIVDKYVRKGEFDGQDLAADFIGLMRAEITMACFIPLCD